MGLRTDRNIAYSASESSDPCSHLTQLRPLCPEYRHPHAGEGCAAQVVPSEGETPSTVHLNACMDACCHAVPDGGGG